MTEDPYLIGQKLRPADRKGLMTRPGSGSFSKAVWDRLMKAGLMDEAFHPTELGYKVRATLR